MNGNISIAIYKNFLFCIGVFVVVANTCLTVLETP